MSDSALSALIIPMNDPHFGEYIQNHFKCIEWLSGFNGSAGTIVVTLEDAALWTDSRYFVQASTQLANSEIKLKRMKMPETESIDRWLKDRLKPGDRVGVNPDIFSLSEYAGLADGLNPLSLVEVDDIFQKVWNNRPIVEQYNISLLDEVYSGEPVISKHERLVNEIGVKEDFLYLISTCDDIAWFFNIRGKDMEYNPVALSYAAVTKDASYLFVGTGTLTDEQKARLKNEKVTIMDYCDFESFIASYPTNAVRIAPQDKISFRKYKMALSNGAAFLPDNTRGGIIANQKAVKNVKEITGFRKAMILDGVAWVKYLKFVEDRLNDKVNPIDEWEAACRIAQLRSESDLYIGESFAPIVAFGPNAALPHYEPSEISHSIIRGNGFLLTDTGGQYICGTTDTTRTISTGELTEEQKRDYTLVLSGMINLAMARFPKGTRGAQLDILARGPVFSAAKMYMHGTGHGIGHYLCVHEGPQSIRMEENPVQLKPGMVTSDEPAVYEEGRYGIRTENVILCREWCESNYGQFYEFETLTLVPIDTKPIIKELLGKERIAWLNEYHSRVFSELSPYLKKPEREWLSAKTINID